MLGSRILINTVISKQDCHIAYKSGVGSKVSRILNFRFEKFFPVKRTVLAPSTSVERVHFTVIVIAGFRI